MSVSSQFNLPVNECLPGGLRAEHFPHSSLLLDVSFFMNLEMSAVYGVTQLELEQVRLLVLFWSRPDRQTQIFYCLQPDAHLITLIL